MEELPLPDQMFSKHGGGGAEFSKLYTHSDTNFDQEFYNECLQHKQSLKDNTALPSYVPNRLLTKIISREEVAHAILNSKEGKAPGFD